MTPRDNWHRIKLFQHKFKYYVYKHFPDKLYLKINNIEHGSFMNKYNFI